MTTRFSADNGMYIKAIQSLMMYAIKVLTFKLFV